MSKSREQLAAEIASKMGILPDRRRVMQAKYLCAEFRKQCEQQPANDPTREVVEVMLGALEGVLNK